METSALTFAQPVWFFALLIVPIVAGLYFWSQKRSDALIAKVVAPRLRPQLAGAVSIGRRAFKSVLILAVFVLVAVALARPQKGFIEREIKQRGRDVIIAVDTSRSMLATDVAPTRLARAKLVAQDLLRLVQGDRVGLIAFAGSAFLQAPLTVDYNAVLVSLDELDTTVIPKGGTNIAAAIRAAEDAFGKGEGQTRALIILTDGEELDADGIAAAKRAAELGVRIFTVGIGSGEGSLIPLRREGGGADFVRDAAGKPVQSRLDETRLREIAEAGGGFYEPLSTDVARMIFEKGILPMETSETGVSSSRQPIEQYQWPLGAAVALLALWMMLGDRRRQSAPRRTVVAAVFFLSGPALLAQTGLEDYQAGNFDQAMVQFEQRLQKAPDSDKLQFNAGAAAYKLGDFGKAVDYFTKALVTEDQKLHEDAAYNLANALVRRGEAAQGKEEKKADWKNAIQHYTEALNIDPKNQQAEENREIVKKMLEELEKEEEQKDDQKQDQKDQQDQQDQKDQQKQDQKQDQQKQDQKDQQDQKDEQQKDQQQQDQKDQSGQDEQKDQQEQKDQKDQQDQKGQDGKNQEKKEDEQKKDGQDGEQKPDEKPKPEEGDEKKDEDQDGKGPEDKPNSQPSQPDAKGGQTPQPTPQPTPGEKKEGELKAGQGEENQEPPQQGQGVAEAEPAEKDGEMSPAQARNLLNSLRSEEGRVQLMKNPETEDTLKDW